MRQSKIVISNAELKEALRKLGKRVSTAYYRRKLVHDLKEVKRFENYLVNKSKKDKTEQEEAEIREMEGSAELTNTEKE